MISVLYSLVFKASMNSYFPQVQSTVDIVTTAIGQNAQLHAEEVSKLDPEHALTQLRQRMAHHARDKRETHNLAILSLARLLVSLNCW